MVEIFDNYFLPSFVFVTPGGTVRWINRGRHKHTVTALAGKPDSGDIPPGGAYTLKVTKPLNHEYYCRHHRLTMSGTIVVRALQAVTPPITPSGYYRPYAYLPGSFSRPPVSPVGGYQSPPPPGNPHGP
ncbi:MAG: hypothetical protein IT429_16830 [Gemmataceae bacterium]|nr:hypothetical protein [Gemmataceae bacterium]